MLAAFAGPAAARHSARTEHRSVSSASGATGSCAQSPPSLPALEALAASGKGPQAISTRTESDPNDSTSSDQAPAASGTTPASTALNYTIAFYPRLFTFLQQSLGTSNCLSGPKGNSVSPVYGAVPAVNNDTLYANFFLNFAEKGSLGVPQVLTIPTLPTAGGRTAHFSLLVLDVFDHVVTTTPDITKIEQPGHSYLLVPKGWHGTAPKGITAVITMPYPVTIWEIRADKYVKNHQTGMPQNVIPLADKFRKSLRLTPLPTYLRHPLSGFTTLLPLSSFAPRAKAIADDLVTSHTTLFFRLLQVALISPTTKPLSASDVALSSAFNHAVAAAEKANRQGKPGPLRVLIHAAQAAHTRIIDNFESHVDQNRWVYFNNFAEWGDTPSEYLDRAGETEILQLSNNATAAGYYSAFTDGGGVPLNGSSHAYQLTFSAGTCTTGCIPEAARFWSLTAYLPRGVTLVPNAAKKYNVASYTPGLQSNPGGSITLYIQAQPPAAHMANWLPVPRGPFLLILRTYGPTGNTTPPAPGNNNPDEAYIPPKIVASSGT